MELDIFNIEDVDKSYKSFENYDGFDDALEVEIARGFENLNFIDTYTAMQQKNSAEMIRMCKKLSVNYGLKSGVNEKAATSIESLCNMYSTEDENKDWLDEPFFITKKKKREVFFQKVIATIKRIFRAIKRFFLKIWKGIKDFFTRITNYKNLSPEEIKQILEDEELWKNAPGFVILRGTIKIERFNRLCNDVYNVIGKKLSTISKNDMNSQNAKNTLSDIDNLFNEVVLKNKNFKGLDSLMFGVEITLNDGEYQKEVVMWAAKGQNLKNAVEAIKSGDKSINDLVSTCDILDKICDTIEDMNKITKDDDIKIKVKTIRKCSIILKCIRENFNDFMKAVMFSMKINNYYNKKC